MATRYQIEKTAIRYTARNRKGEVLAFICKEEDNYIRVDFQVSYGWESEVFEGKFDELTEAKAKKIFQNYL